MTTTSSARCMALLVAGFPWVSDDVADLDFLDLLHVHTCLRSLHFHTLLPWDPTSTMHNTRPLTNNIHPIGMGVLLCAVWCGLLLGVPGG